MKKVLKKLLKKNFKDIVIINNYYKNIKNIIKFSYEFFGFITYSQIYFFLYNINFNHIEKILLIIKKIGIIIYTEIPNKNCIKDFNNFNPKNNELKVKDELNNMNKKYFFKNIYYRHIRNIRNMTEKEIDYNYYLIKLYLKKNSLIVFKNINLLIYILIYNKKKFLKIFNIKKFYNIYEYFNDFKYNFFNFILSENNEKYDINNNEFKYNINNFKNKIKKNKKNKKLNKIYEKTKDFDKNIKYAFLNKIKYFLKNITKEKNNNKKNFYEKLLLNHLKNFTIDYIMLDEIYKLLKKIYIKIKKIKYELFDVLINISDINLINFKFNFIKNSSNLDWIFNINNLDNFNENLKKKYFSFIEKKRNKLIDIEKNLSMSIESFLKIFYFFQINKYKINLIKNNLLESHLNLVYKIVKKYYNKSFYLDYLQEGNLGLLKAINNYIYYNDIKFSTFACNYIKNNINKFFYKNEKLIKIPEYITILSKKLKKIIKNYVELNNEEPSSDYLLDKMNISFKKLKNIIKLSKETISFDSKLNENDNLNLIDKIKDENSKNPEQLLYDNKIKFYIKKSLKGLNERLVKILFMRYGLNNYKKHTLAEVGLKYNISKERVRQLQNIALEKLKHPSRSKFLKNFFINKKEGL